MTTAYIYKWTHSEASKIKMRGPRAKYGPQSIEHVEKRAATKRGIKRPDLVDRNHIQSGNNHPSYGKKQSSEWRAKNSAAHIGKIKERSTCPHCNLEGGSGAMTRWHFSNCKFKKEF